MSAVICADVVAIFSIALMIWIGSPDTKALGIIGSVVSH